MPKKVIPIVIIIITALIIGSTAYLLARPKIESNSTQTQDDTAVPQKTETPPENPEAASPSAPQPAGSYTDYSTEAFATASGRRVLFFHASWCPQCRNIDKTIKTGGVPAGMTVLKVDYDSNQKLRQTYGVTLQTTFVEVDAQGNLKKKHVAYNQPTWDAALGALGK